jgi:PAS domain-containing protein
MFSSYRNSMLRLKVASYTMWSAMRVATPHCNGEVDIGVMTRTPREETKRQILETGVKLLMERGLEGGCENVGMSDVLSVIADSSGRRITNASVYGRIWANQNEFHRDLVLLAAEQFPAGEEIAMRQVAEQVFATLPLATLEDRREAFREVCRQAGVAHLASLANSRSWQTWLAIWAITVSTPTLDDDLERGPAIAHRHDMAVNAMSAVLIDILPRVGGVLRPGISMYQLSMAIYALSEGLVLHDRFAADDHSIVHVGDRDWSLFSVALHGILERFVELT